MTDSCNSLSLKTPVTVNDSIVGCTTT